MQFLKTDFIHDWLLSNFDICFITETHMTKGEVYNIESFQSFHNSYSQPSCDHPRGGISCFIQMKIMKNISKVDIEVENFIILTLKGNHTLFGAYITPSDSLYFDETLFAELGNVFSPMDSNYSVIGGGDLNCRVGRLTVTPPLPQANYRQNPDPETNSHGKTLKRICKSYNYFVLNNLSLQDKVFDGKITYRKGERTSQVDLCLANVTALHVIDNFKILDIGWNPSDHSPVSISFSLPDIDENVAIFASEDINTTASIPARKKPTKVVSDNVNWQSYAAILHTAVPKLADNL